MNTKSDLLSKRNLRFAVVFILVALAAGIYFLFRPFPAGPSLVAGANAISSGAQESASVQKLKIGGGYVLENSAQGSRIVAPSNPQIATKPTVIRAKIDIGGGYMRVLTKYGWTTIRLRK
jgi:hypothetical protein